MTNDDRTAPAVSVILVSYNSASIISSAIRPLVGQNDIEVIVVDNASSDGSPETIRQLFPEVVVLPMGENLGFAKAVNIGVRASRGTTILLLNPDAVINLSALRALREALTIPGTGLVAPILDNPDKQQTVVSAGFLPTLRRMTAHYSGLARLGHRVPALRGHYLYENQLPLTPMRVDWVTGACMLFERSTWLKVGGLSERWFMYAEDIDFCRRITSAGYTVVLDTRTRAEHLVGESDSTKSFKVNPAWVVNTKDFYSAQLAPSRAHVAAWGLVVGLGLIARALVFQGRAQAGPAAQRAASHTLAVQFRVYAKAAMLSRPRR